MEEGVAEEVTDTVYQVPVPLAETRQDIVVAALEDVQMGLGQTRAPEQRLKE